jgi:hypothetical protein
MTLSSSKPVAIPASSQRNWIVNTHALYLLQQKPPKEYSQPIEEEVEDVLDFGQKLTHSDDIQIEDTKSLRTSLRELVSEISDIFSTQVRQKQA